MDKMIKETVSAGAVAGTMSGNMAILGGGLQGTAGQPTDIKKRKKPSGFMNFKDWIIKDLKNGK